MPNLEGEYVPSTSQWVRDQIELYERTGGKEGRSLPNTDMAVIIVTMRGAKTNAIRKIALMRVEHEGEYALVASMGGAPTNPSWYANLKANPNDVTIQDGPEPFAVTVREVSGADYDAWWERAARAFPNYNEYQSKTARTIPILVASRA